MKLLLKLILLVILTSVCYSQGKIVPIETITRDFGEVTQEVIMSVAEFTALINKTNQQSRSFGVENINSEKFSLTAVKGNTVGLKLVNGRLVVKETFVPEVSKAIGYEMMPAVEPIGGFKHFNVDIISSLNLMGGEAEIKIQSRSGELVLTNGNKSYNYVGY